MSCMSYLDLHRHVGHQIVCVEYGNWENVAVECETCHEVLMDFNRTPDDLQDQQRRQAQRRQDELAEQALKR